MLLSMPARKRGTDMALASSARAPQAGGLLRQPTIGMRRSIKGKSKGTLRSFHIFYA
jgi:hypothetical protein